MNQPVNEIPRRLSSAWRRHERRWRDNRYVYAVISRRSRGVSVGINLNPDKRCNFGCIYCQVNRRIPPKYGRVDLEVLHEELNRILQAEKDGSLYLDEPFSVLVPVERGVRDLAFSGDGEPTAFPHFEQAVRLAAQARRNFGLDSTRLILITNGAYLNKSSVRSALKLLDENNGEIWAKLDAGTEEHFRQVNRPNVSLKKILDNILEAARKRPLIIQSLWFRIQGSPPPVKEIEAYCDRLSALLSEKGQLKSLQLYTIARDPADPSTSPLTNGELEQIESLVKSRVPVPIEVFFSSM
jgi:wyosine [tRNA(Phe)-imidazoG37] synthetase (radical SAM superfamily)